MKNIEIKGNILKAKYLNMVRIPKIYLGNKTVLYLLSTLLMPILLIPASEANNEASISLYGEKTDVYLGQDILLKLSVVNYISNPKMSLQVIIVPPSGMSVTSSEFSKTAAGQYASNYQLDPGDGRDIEINMRSNEAGEFNVKGRVVYYFGDQKDKSQYYETELPIKVRRPTVLTDTKSKLPQQNEAKKGMMEFEIILVGIGMIAIVLIVSVIMIYMLRRHN